MRLSVPFTGQEDWDLTAAAAYVQAATVAAPRDADRIIQAVLRAMIRAVADPLGAVFMPLEFTHFHRELRGEHTGIGVQVDAVRGQIVFSDVTAVGPAARGGITPGDVLVQAYGRTVADSTPDEVMDRLHGAAGTTVVLVVRRAAGGTVHLSLVREPVRENPTRWKMIEPVWREGAASMCHATGRPMRKAWPATPSPQAKRAPQDCIQKRPKAGPI